MYVGRYVLYREVVLGDVEKRKSMPQYESNPRLHDRSALTLTSTVVMTEASGLLLMSVPQGKGLNEVLHLEYSIRTAT